ncbi:hypothetical protein CYLTODRAFT_382256 [Cylindrobasidium torrendii FP15055 ss-10]|uniref:Major facilitator superfamily (MFS) profile domain-containing protein n=1 Tax=Cylindrobasidium torrendii FP15055 ss-10 TaxID=1314674 RepID=A0A0D7AZ16_9AGAR|nr:hypothetical protein CYLTODRAFT_382256 [Cylindrobasidium torrendii FP15055 ss-10]
MSKTSIIENEKHHDMQLEDGASVLGAKDVNIKLVNPLRQFGRDELIERARAFAERCERPDLQDTFAKGALIAAHPGLFESEEMLNAEDKEWIRRETTHKWSQPKTLYWMVICCSLAAAVQGMDQSAINGANLFFPSQFGIPQGRGQPERNEWIHGMVNAMPYFSCSLIANWFTDPLNRYLGRRGTIFLTCGIAFITCIWSALTDSWWHLMLARFFLGFGIGPKSATVPVYAAECTPAAIRGGLVMQWQMWTAFGIMMGYVADLAFYSVPDQSGIVGLNWRLMLGSAAIPPIFVMIQVFFCPESPRWYMSKGRFADAFKSMQRLRNADLLAARDLFLAHEILEAEHEVSSMMKRNKLVELIAVPRNRKGMMGSGLVMFMQQFCGINVIAYYSSSIFADAGATQMESLGASLGWGACNFLFALPAIWTIDVFGRRTLLCIGFPAMSLALWFTGASFNIPEGSTARIACVALGTYLHCIFYSPSEGPVPFTYSAESFPLYVRDLGMSWAVSVCWFFNGVLSLTWPPLQRAFTPQGAFYYYAAWNLFGWTMVYFFLPETKGLTLEELDAVFSVKNRTHMKYQFRQISYYMQKYVFGHKELQKEPLYLHEKLSMEERMAAGTFAPAAAGH